MSDKKFSFQKNQSAKSQSTDLSDRQVRLLLAVIESYLPSAQPVGSKLLSQEGGFSESGATLRNELRALEERGYLTHPHTSAGRVPTERGYRFYADRLVVPEVSSVNKISALVVTAIKRAKTRPEAIKNLARFSSEAIGLAAVACLPENSFYYTGLTRLFERPELKNMNLVLNVGTVFDECEARFPEIMRSLQIGQIRFFIGEENPLGRFLTTAAVRFSDTEALAMVGTMRFPYRETMAVLYSIGFNFKSV